MNGLPTPPPDWSLDALCAQTDPDSFFPTVGASIRAARRTCDACDVRAECLQYAIDNHEMHGVWGGTTPAERAAMAGWRPMHGSYADAIDPVAVERAISGEPVHLTRAERRAVVPILAARGMSDGAIAARCGAAERTVIRDRISLGIESRWVA